MDLLGTGQQTQSPGVIPIQEQIEGGYEYRGYAYQKLAGLETRRQATGAPVLSEYIHPGGGVEIYLRAANSGHLVRITESEGGFICHPRDNTNPGGAKPGGVAIPPTYQYPLVDDDHGSRVLTYEKDAWAVSSEVENYGNLDWMGPDGDVVSWRGPCGRQFPMDDTVSYPGFTEWDYTTISGGVETEHYTPYRNLAYQAGEVAEFLTGYKVLGCGLRGGSLVCVVGVDYAGKENPDGGTGGFYDEVWLGGARIGWRSSSRPSIPWFFDSQGTEAVSGDTKLSIAEDGTCTFSALTAGSGTQTNEYDGSDSTVWGTTKSGAWPMLRDFFGTEVKSITLNLSFSEHSQVQSEGVETYEDLDILISGEPFDTLTVSGPDAATVGAQYGVILSGGTGACDNLEVDWSFSGGTISSAGVIQTITGCGMGVVSAALKSDLLPLSGSKDVRLPDGVWVDLGTEYFRGWNPDYGCPPSVECTVIQGKYKYFECIYGGRSNIVYGTGMDWNAYYQECRSRPDAILGDGGFPPEYEPPKCGPLIGDSTTYDDGHGCASPVTYYWYNSCAKRTTYEWRCP